MFGILFCFVLTAAITSTTSQTAPQAAQARDDPSPATMIEEVRFHNFWNLVLLVLHALQFPNSFSFNFEVAFCAYILCFTLALS